MNTPLKPTEIARETLRQLSTHRIAPTPDNYRELYHRIAGPAGGEEDEELAGKLGQFAVHLARSGLHAEACAALEKALARRDWKNLSALLLVVAQADENRTRPAQAAERQDSREWTKTLRSLTQCLEINHAGWTRAKKRDALDTLLNSTPRDPDDLLTRLRTMVTNWEEHALARTGFEDSDAAPEAVPDTPENVMPQLRDCLFTALDVALPALLRHAPDLAWEARTLAGRARQANDAAALAQLGNDLRLFTRRAELHGGGDGQIRDALLRLLRLIVDNIQELVDGDHWIQGQVAIVKNVLDRPLTPEVIEEAERAIKDLMVRQGALRRSLDEARASLKALLQDFIERLGGMSNDTTEYQAKLQSYTSRLKSTDSIAALNHLIRDLLVDTQAMHDATEQTRQALTASRQHVQAAEVRIKQMERELVHLTERAREDHLTGTLNRRGLDEAFKRESARADRQGTPMCVALLDIDNFKKLNDTLGHQAGDEALRHIVQVVKEHLRPADSLARYGGEEFVILLPDSDVPAATEVMSRLQRELTKRFFLHNNEKLLITFSCGISPRASGEDLEPAVARADRALYQAKRSGKNRVVAATVD